MIRVLSFILSVAVATPLFAQTVRIEDCGYQGDVVAAVQAARVARVGEREVAEHIAGTTPEWPEKYNAIVPLVTPWVYTMKMGEVRKADLKAAWNEMCLAQE
ncbi:hypothetical protein [Sulfitobacter guttiformis]|uniref:HdeA/HdeB family protein n=1 Tax=Sulfitobacter guttiformis TaxID=74349 RepID=A0A420DNI6_9RHOB|nr:hypothetical protein [Sulfitobacter guttiformis]KIN73173.1 hypothetical protein Z949_2358 [Sulfitobacter guttiformis KCTC 32187]RKE95854.1 hypothetical protein C8N30_0398 [Sulfitobacter guttiformis]